MASIWDYSATPGSNNAAAPNGMPEGMPPSGVNDAWRQGIALMFEGLAKSTVAGGTADALTVTFANAPSAPSTLIDGMEIKLRAAAANATTTPTLAVNGGTARTITKRGGTALGVGDIPGNLTELDMRYNLANTRWELLNPAWPLFSPITASLGGDVALNNTGLYFTGPQVAQGTAGTWFGAGSVVIVDTAVLAQFNIKLWDGATVIDSAAVTATVNNVDILVALSGFITSPAGNLRISVQDGSSTSGLIKFNASGNSKDSTITAIRIG